MERVHQGFGSDGIYAQLMDASTPFRLPNQVNSIRGRSWAIHDGVLGHAYTDVTMYKSVGKAAGINTFPGAEW
jgi:hypothetical protein